MYRTHKILLLLLLILILIVFIGCGSIHQEYRYSVVSVTRYNSQRQVPFTNIVSLETRYSFTYIDDKGSLITMDNFTNSSYGLTSVRLGDKNEYVRYNDGVDTFEILYLTQDTLSSL